MSKLFKVTELILNAVDLNPWIILLHVTYINLWLTLTQLQGPTWGKKFSVKISHV